MQKTFYVYNQTRQAFLSMGVTVADTHLASLRGLLGKRSLKSDEGIWVVPSQGIHTIGVLFPIDVIYLDADQKVIHLVEHLRPFRLGPIRVGCESVLELPVRTIYASHTQIGDSFLISSAEETSGRAQRSEATPWKVGQVDTGMGRLRLFGKWFNRWVRALKDRRECARSTAPVVAHYWNGGISQACEVKSVSPVGAYLVTADRWHPGTVLRLTFQYANVSRQVVATEGGETAALMVRGRIIRNGPDGVGIRLVYLNKKERSRFAKFLAAAPRRVA